MQLLHQHFHWDWNLVAGLSQRERLKHDVACCLVTSLRNKLADWPANYHKQPERFPKSSATIQKNQWMSWLQTSQQRSKVALAKRVDEAKCPSKKYIGVQAKMSIGVAYFAQFEFEFLARFRVWTRCRITHRHCYWNIVNLLKFLEGNSDHKLQVIWHWSTHWISVDLHTSSGLEHELEQETWSRAEANGILDNCMKNENPKFIVFEFFPSFSFRRTSVWASCWGWPGLPLPSSLPC